MGAVLPWAHRSAFAELMLGWELRSWPEASALSGITLFDRGVPDVVGYLTLSGLTVPQHVRNAAALFRYNRRVFIAPPWQAIFAQTDMGGSRGDLSRHGRCLFRARLRAGGLAARHDRRPSPVRAERNYIAAMNTVQAGH